jgi:hypothetical protein
MPRKEVISVAELTHLLEQGVYKFEVGGVEISGLRVLVIDGVPLFAPLVQIKIRVPCIRGVLKGATFEVVPPEGDDPGIIKIFPAPKNQTT